MEAQNLIVKAEKPNLVKIIAITAIVGGAGYYLWKKYGNQVEDVLPDMEIDSMTVIPEDLRNIYIWQYAILSSEDWTKKMSLKYGIKDWLKGLKQEAQDLYFEKGPFPDQGMIDSFDRKVNSKKYTISNSQNWYADVTKQAEARGLSVEELLLRNAMYSVIQDLVRKRTKDIAKYRIPPSDREARGGGDEGGRGSGGDEGGGGGGDYYPGRGHRY